jgi:beta-lactamase superfamily II metal-dependent hydrolase
LSGKSAAYRSLVHRLLRRSFADWRIAPANLSAGESFKVSPQVAGKILFPPRQFAAGAADDEAFVVQLLVPPATKVLFTSDSGYATEDALLAFGADLDSDILIKGQNHSGKSGSERFLDAVKPKLIVATSRDFPEYERIGDEWAERVQRRGIKLLRQDETGAVEIYFGEREWNARAYLTGETFRSVNR